MSTGWKIKNMAAVLLLCLGLVPVAMASPQTAASAPTTASSTAHRKTSKAKKPQKPQKPQPAPLPSGPTGSPVQPIPLDSMAPVPPQVSYQNAQLTIVAPNSTLGDILRAVRKQTGAEIEIPSAPERVVTHLGPGSPRDVLAELLNGSRFNYVLLGSPANSALLTRVVLVAKSAPENPGANAAAVAGEQQPGVTQHSGGPGAAPLPEVAGDTPDAEMNDTPDDNAEQPAADAEQPQGSPEQPAVKTPQQMLQEMQQRQLQMQQQNGQPPTPPAGVPQAPQQPQ